MTSLLASTVDTVALSEDDFQEARILFRNIEMFRDWLFESFYSGNIMPLINRIPAFTRHDLTHLGFSIGTWFSHDYEPTFSLLQDIAISGKSKPIRDSVREIYAFAQRALFDRVQMSPLAEFNRRSTLAHCESTSHSTLHAEEIIGGPFYQGYEDVVSMLVQKDGYRISTEKSLFFRRFGIHHIECMYLEQESRIAFNLLLRNGLTPRFDMPRRIDDEETYQTNIDRNLLSWELVSQLTIGLQAILLDMLRLGGNPQRIRETRRIAQELLKPEGFRDILPLRTQYIWGTELGLPTHVGCQRIIYHQDHFHVCDYIDPDTGEVTEKPIIEGTSYAPIRLPAENVRQVIGQLQRLGMAAGVEVLDPYDDWHDLYQALGRYSWIAAVELILLNRI